MLSPAPAHLQPHDALVPGGQRLPQAGHLAELQGVGLGSRQGLSLFALLLHKPVRLRCTGSPTLTSSPCRCSVASICKHLSW